MRFGCLDEKGTIGIIIVLYLNEIYVTYGSVLAFLAAIILVSLIIPKMGPFLSLIVAAILFGLLVGMGQELIGYMATGLGRIFSSPGDSGIQRCPAGRVPAQNWSN